MELRSLTPEESLALGRGERSLREILAIPEDLLAFGANIGRTALVAGRLDVVETIARGLLAADSKYAYGHALLAAWHTARGNRNDALEEARATLALANGDAELCRTATNLVTRLSAHSQPDKPTK